MVCWTSVRLHKVLGYSAVGWSSLWSTYMKFVSDSFFPASELERSNTFTVRRQNLVEIFVEDANSRRTLQVRTSIISSLLVSIEDCFVGRMPKTDARYESYLQTVPEISCVVGRCCSCLPSSSQGQHALLRLSKHPLKCIVARRLDHHSREYRYQARIQGYPRRTVSC